MGNAAADQRRAKAFAKTKPRSSRVWVEPLGAFHFFFALNPAFSYFIRSYIPQSLLLTPLFFRDRENGKQLMTITNARQISKNLSMISD